MIRQTTLCPIAFLVLCLFYPFSEGFAQTGSVYGVVTDSVTGQPVVNLTVFIPSTTSGTTTNENGEYHLDGINPGDYVLMFRHISYPSTTRYISIKTGKTLEVNVILAEQQKKLKEVVVYGKIPDRRMGYHLFKQYFLGDESEKTCILENPEVLNYYYEDKTLMVVAREPLKIVNRYLGYRVTFFLDYFRCGDGTKTEFNFYDIGYFGYSGVALYEDMSASIPMRSLGWKINRSGEFKGSLRHFLASLYRNELTANSYTVRRACSGLKEIQLVEKQSNAMTKIKMAQMDSLASWNHLTGTSDVLYFYPFTEYPLKGLRSADEPADGPKSLSTDAELLVFRDFNNTRDLSDDFISTLQITGEGIEFDRDGNLWAKKGELKWVNLDNTLQIKRLLPFDYMPKMKGER